MTRRDRSDPDLVAAARGGDRRPFAVLVERHYGVLELARDLAELSQPPAEPGSAS